MDEPLVETVGEPPEDPQFLVVFEDDGVKMYVWDGLQITAAIALDWALAVQLAQDIRAQNKAKELRCRSSE